jgi:hypothetical protein
VTSPFFIAILAALITFSGKGAAMADTDMNWRTWCIGRHLVDVPAQFVPQENFGSINGMRVDRLGPGSSDRLQSLVDQRAQALSSGSEAEEGVPLVFRAAYREGDVHVLAHELELGQAPGTAFTWTEEAYVVKHGVIMRVVQVLSQDDEAGPRGQMLDLAGRIAPSRRDDTPEGPGACLPDAMAQVPMTSEVHGMTFAPKDAEGAPVGMDITIISRSPLDPPLDPRLPSGAGARQITFAGMGGLIMEAPTSVGPSRIAVVHRPAAGDRPALRIEVYYYDERPASEAPPDAAEQAQMIFDRVIGSIRARSGAE